MTDFNYKGSGKVEQPNFGVKLAAVYLLFALLIAAFVALFPLSYKPNQLDPANAFMAPFQGGTTRHWLGTDQLGRDVFSGLLYGFRTAFLIAVPVMTLAILLGSFLGGIAGYFGNRQLKTNYAALLSFEVWLFLMYFYFFYREQVTLSTSDKTVSRYLIQAFLIKFLWFSGVTLVVLLYSFLLKTVPFLAKKRPFPLDEFILKGIEILSAVPRLILILCLVAFAEPGLGTVVLLLSLTYWSGPARLVRAEVLRIKELPYIEAAKASGFSNYRILLFQIMPNAAGPLIVAFFYGLGNLLSLEATLSFLGIGLPPETPGWGRMLSGFRLDFTAWWLLVFPAAVLFATILALQGCGNYLQKLINRK